MEKLNTDKVLYQVLRSVVEKGDVVPTDDVDKNVAKLFLFDFELSGIHLSEDERKRVIQLNDYINHIGSHFYQRTMEETKLPKEQVPQQFWGNFEPSGNDLIIKGLESNADDEKLRELAFRLYYQNDEHREKLLKQLLTARKVLSKLCGFQSYSDRAVIGGIFDTQKVVNEFLDQLLIDLQPHIESDKKRLLKVKHRYNPSATDIKPWDTSYLSSVVMRDQLSHYIHQSFPYFSIGTCMDGLNNIFKSILGIRLEESKPQEGELWSPDVVKLVVLNESNNNLGYIYCDFFERDGKVHHDCHYTIQGGCKLADGTYQNPIVVIMLNLTKPSGSQPCLLSPEKVDNLFHEMGHAIHSMLARTPYQHTTGTRCSTDLAEVPSILMEYFLLDKRVVGSFAKHYATGNPIPEDTLEAWIAGKKIFSASDLQLQLFYSALDQHYHANDPLQGKMYTTWVLEKVTKKYYNMEYIPGTAFQLRFGHLYSYGAKYYSYLLSRAVASQIWQKLFAADPFSRQAGTIYLDKLLSHGGSKPPSAIVEDILEHSIDPCYFSKILVEDVERNSLTSEEFIK